MYWLLLVIILCFSNFRRAKAQNLLGISWAVYTFVAAIAAGFLGILISVIILMVRFPELQQIAIEAAGNQQVVTEALMQRVNPLIMELFYLVCSFGGYLWVRHLLIKRARNSTE
jgi:hypothetical protein